MNAENDVGVDAIDDGNTTVGSFFSLLCPCLFCPSFAEAGAMSHFNR